MEKEYYSRETFRNTFANWNHMDSRTSDIFLNSEYVYKILNSRIPLYKRKENRIDEIALLNDELITVPDRKVYINNQYFGFRMKNGGIPLLEYIFNNNIDFTGKLEILHKIKNIIEYLDKLGIIHGDVRLSNFLFKDGIIRLTDVNNMIFSDDQEDHANLLYKDWYKATGTFKFLDEYACNLICFLLLNYPTEFLINIFSRDFYFDNNFLKDLLNIKCDKFDQEVLQGVKASILGDRDAIKQLKPNTFLIDYLR